MMKVNVRNKEKEVKERINKKSSQNPSNKEIKSK
jgi:hypothetical protein